MKDGGSELIHSSIIPDVGLILTSRVMKVLSQSQFVETFIFLQYSECHSCPLISRNGSCG